MIIEDGSENLYYLIIHQLDAHWMFYNRRRVEEAIPYALRCMENNMTTLNDVCKYAFDAEGNILFSPYNTVEYAIFLYYLSHELWNKGGEKEACLVYWLNKMMNCVELFYEVELPEHFWCEHPLGSVLGRGHYGDCFFFYQSVTVGGNDPLAKKSIYPIIGNNVILCAGCSVLGESHIGNNVIVSAGTIVRNQDVPSDSIVFGVSPNLVIRSRQENDNSIWR